MVAQAPDECRRSSFWEAIKKHQARVLVVLGRVQHVYWPQENGQSITCDKLEVQHQSTCTQDGGILERCLRIVNEVTKNGPIKFLFGRGGAWESPHDTL